MLPSLHPRVHDQRRRPNVAVYKYSERSISTVAGVESRSGQALIRDYLGDEVSATEIGRLNSI